VHLIAVIETFGDKSPSAVWGRPAALHITLVGVYFTQEYQERNLDKSEKGDCSLT
jgi:hypothetical protein